MRKILLLFVISISLASCDVDNSCGECSTPPRQFNFDFIDKITEENLFTNETFDSEYLTVIDETGAEVDFQLVNYNESYILSLTTIGWELEPKVYTVKLSEDISVEIEVDMDKIEGECCTYFVVEAFNIGTYEFSESSTTGIISVKI